MLFSIFLIASFPLMTGGKEAKLVIFCLFQKREVSASLRFFSLYPPNLYVKERPKVR